MSLANATATKLKKQRDNQDTLDFNADGGLGNDYDFQS